MFLSLVPLQVVPALHLVAPEKRALCVVFLDKPHLLCLLFVTGSHVFFDVFPFFSVFVTEGAEYSFLVLLTSMHSGFGGLATKSLFEGVGQGVEAKW
jgi:hypothetical protein